MLDDYGSAKRSIELREHLANTAAPRGSVSLGSETVDVYVIQRSYSGIAVLTLRAAADPKNTKLPVVGFIKAGETATQAALRELRSQTGIGPDDPQFVDMWSCSPVYPFFVAELNRIVLSLRFVVEVAGEWKPILGKKHVSFAWGVLDLNEVNTVSGPTFDGLRQSEWRDWPGMWATVMEIANAGANRELGGESAFPLMRVNLKATGADA